MCYSPTLPSDRHPCVRCTPSCARGRLTGHYSLLVPDTFGSVLVAEPCPRTQLLPRVCLPLLPPATIAHDPFHTPAPIVHGTWITAGMTRQVSQPWWEWADWPRILGLSKPAAAFWWSPPTGSCVATAGTCVCMTTRSLRCFQHSIGLVLAWAACVVAFPKCFADVEFHLGLGARLANKTLHDTLETLV